MATNRSRLTVIGVALAIIAAADQALDGTYRAIRLKVAGPPRLSVHTRTGYWATPNPSTSQ